jgi:hypothetical protein
MLSIVVEHVDSTPRHDICSSIIQPPTKTVATMTTLSLFVVGVTTMTTTMVAMTDGVEVQS